MGTLRIVSFNAGTLFEPHWDLRLPRIAAAIDALEPDVVCLQEIATSSSRPNAAGEIVDALAARGSDLTHWVFGGFAVREGLVPDEPDLQFGSAVVARWPVEEVATHRLPVEPDDRTVLSVGWELLHARVLDLDVFSTHLCPAPVDANHRRLQVQEIARLMRAGRPETDTNPWSPERPSMPAVLCGDFNAEPDSDEIRFLCGLTPLGGVDTFHQDAWRVGGDGTGGFTNDWRNPMGGALNIHRKRIDYIFVGDPFARRDDGGRVLDAKVVLDEVVDGVPLSDHVGVMAEIVWPDKPA